MRDFSFRLTAEDVAKQAGVTIEEAKAYIKELKYVGFFVSASDGETIAILPPNLDDPKRQEELAHMKDYEKEMNRHRPIAIQQGLIGLNHVRPHEVHLLPEDKQREWERLQYDAKQG